MELVKEYTNGEVTIVWKQALCTHSGNCARGLAAVFKPKEKPWILPENSTTEKIIETINKCPSGALSFYINKSLIFLHFTFYLTQFNIILEI